MAALVLGLGSSAQSRRWMDAAVAILHARVGVLSHSRLYRSAPAGGVAQQWFWNAAVLVEGEPLAVLEQVLQIETDLGRKRGPRWGDRRVDIDLLWSPDLIVEQPGLSLPHPRLLERDFAIAPLLEIAPGARDPRTGQSIAARPPCLPRALAAGTLGQVGCDPLSLALAQGRSAAYLRPRSAGFAQHGTRHPSPSPRRGSIPMKFFIDTANLDEIRQAARWGIIDGVTTNPSLIAKEGRDFVETIAEICTLVDGPVSAEVVAEDAETMVKQGKLLARIHDNVVVKVPLTKEGIVATSQLSALGIKTNVTLCFQPIQALVAAKAGATYISPFVGRIDDVGRDGMMMIEDMVQVYSNYPDLETEILAASIRHPQHVLQAALAGAHVATIPFNVLNKLFSHPLTDKGNAQFTAAWEGVPDSDIVGQVSAWLDKNER